MGIQTSLDAMYRAVVLPSFFSSFVWHQQPSMWPRIPKPEMRFWDPNGPERGQTQIDNTPVSYLWHSSSIAVAFSCVHSYMHTLPCGLIPKAATSPHRDKMHQHKIQYTTKNNEEPHVHAMSTKTGCISDKKDKTPNHLDETMQAPIRACRTTRACQTTHPHPITVVVLTDADDPHGHLYHVPARKCPGRKWIQGW